MPTRCAIRPIGSSSRGCWRCPGVAHVIVFGGARAADPDPAGHAASSASFGLTFTDVADAARAALPLRGAGFIDLAAQRMLLQSPTPQPDVEAIGAGRGHRAQRHARCCCATGARSRWRPALRSGDALIMGKPGVCCRSPASTAPTRSTTTLAVEKALADLEPALKSAGHHAVSGAAPAGQLHRARARRSREVAADRGGADPGGAVPVPARRARRADRLHRHSAVAAGRGGRARSDGARRSTP